MQSVMKKTVLQKRTSLNIFQLSSRCLSDKSDDYQYISKSEIPTLHFQQSLPRLPIPELKNTCERYLLAQNPLLTENDLPRIKENVERFLNTEGPPLQAELKANDAANKHTSYISIPWFDMYLKDRKPLPINYNPFLVFIDDPKMEYNTQLIRSTNLLISSLRFMKSLRENLLEPEIFHLNPKKSNTKFFRTFTGLLPSSISWYGAYLFKAFPLDMSQYNNLFGTARIPKPDKDILYHDQNSKHIIVMKNGNFYKMDVLDDSGNIFDAQKIFTNLHYILNLPDEKAEFPIGILTCDDRNTWATARKCLEDSGNKDVLNIIDSALFNLILDSESPSRDDYGSIIRQYLYSDGTNRWFDKSFSLIVQKNGIAGINFEHSWGDGVAVLRYFQDVYKDSTNKQRIHPNDKPSSLNAETNVVPLKFKLNDNSKNYIIEAKKRFSDTTEKLNINFLEQKQFGRNLCKQHSISPDSLMQLAFQIAHFRLNNKFVSTYESCSTAAFKHGRTETMRPCTNETKDFCLTFSSKDKPSKSVIIEKIKKCSEVHGQLVKEAAMGQGFDRHLFALKILAEKKKMIPKLYTDPVYAQFNHYVLSTSTLNADELMLGAFGPVVPDGFGIGYSIWKDRLGTIVSNYKDKTNGEGYIECLRLTLEELYDYLK